MANYRGHLIHHLSVKRIWVLKHQCLFLSSIIIWNNLASWAVWCVETSVLWLTVGTEGLALCLLCWVTALCADATKLLPARSCLFIRPCIPHKSLFLYQWGLVGQTRLSLFLNRNTLIDKKPVFAYLQRLGFSRPLMDRIPSEGPISSPPLCLFLSLWHLSSMICLHYYPFIP